MPRTCRSQALGPAVPSVFCVVTLGSTLRRGACGARYRPRPTHYRRRMGRPPPPAMAHHGPPHTGICHPQPPRPGQTLATKALRHRHRRRVAPATSTHPARVHTPFKRRQGTTRRRGAGARPKPEKPKPEQAAATACGVACPACCPRPWRRNTAWASSGRGPGRPCFFCGKLQGEADARGEPVAARDGRSGKAWYGGGSTR